MNWNKINKNNKKMEVLKEILKKISKIKSSNHADTIRHKMLPFINQPEWGYYALMLSSLYIPKKGNVQAIYI